MIIKFGISLLFESIKVSGMEHAVSDKKAKKRYKAPDFVARVLNNI